MRRPARLIAALCAVSLVAAACSDDDDESTDVETTAVETTVAATTSPTTEPVATTEAPATTEAAPETTEAAPETTEAEETTTTVASIGSIVDVATEAGTFTTLLAAAEAAGLVEELSTRELTLLAPTDEAFAALGQATIDGLLADPVALEAVLRNHLLPVPQTAEQIVLFNNVLTVSGGSLPVVSDGTTVTIGGATVVTADVLADNGVIHVIDTVLVPAPAG